MLNEEKAILVFDPDKVKQTKTYSISVGDVTRVKDMGEFLGKISDAEVLHRAIGLMYAQTFPNEPVRWAKMAKRDNPISKKFLPKDARRVTLPDGRRAWIIGGKQFASKREYLDSLKRPEIVEKDAASG